MSKHALLSEQPLPSMACSPVVTGTPLPVPAAGHICSLGLWPCLLVWADMSSSTKRLGPDASTVLHHCSFTAPSSALASTEAQKHTSIHYRGLRLCQWTEPWNTDNNHQSCQQIRVWRRSRCPPTRNPRPQSENVIYFPYGPLAEIEGHLV